MQKNHRLLTVLVCLLLTGTSALAQWATQQMDLQPGWNAVHLEVQPVASECGVVFSNATVEAVYWWRREGASAEFDVDPEGNTHSKSWEWK